MDTTTLGAAQALAKSIPGTAVSEAAAVLEEAETVAASIPQDYSELSEDVDDLKSEIGDYISYTLYNDNPLSNAVILTSGDVESGETVNYDFTVPDDSATYLDVLDTNGVRITYIGKGSSQTGELVYSGAYTIPVNFGSIKFFTNASSQAKLTHVQLYIKSVQQSINDSIFDAIETQNEEIADIRRKFNDGENIIPTGSLLKWTVIQNANDTMYQTIKTPGLSWVTRPIDLNETKARKYTGYNIYVVYVYDSNGNYLSRVVASTQSGVHSFDFTNTPHRYIRCVIKGTYENDCGLFLGDTVPTVYHNNNYLHEVDGNAILEKRAFLVSGDLESQYYRMPFCAYTNDGVLILGGEMRISSLSDTGEISLAITRSLDNGKSFEPPTCLLPHHVDPNVLYHQIACGQLLVNKYTGRIFCFGLCVDSNVDRGITVTDKAGFNSSIVYKYSDDSGKTWSTEQSIDLRTSDMMFMCPSPGNGITLTDGTLVVPAWGRYSNDEMHSFFIYSIDNGATWNFSGNYLPEISNECCAVEMPDGSVMINARPNSGYYRYAYITTDLGTTYTEYISSGYSLATPQVSASMIKCEYRDSSIYLVSTPTGAQDVRANTQLLCSIDMISFKPIISISDVATRGYTGLALYGDTLNIVEETTNDQLTCATIVLPQTVMNDGNHVLPIVNGANNLIRGTLSYNKASGKLVFVDETGQVHNIAFEE